jgi:hypothetical protein
MVGLVHFAKALLMRAAVHLILVFHLFTDEIKTLQNILETFIANFINFKLVLFLLSVVLSLIMTYFFKNQEIFYVHDI